MLGTGMPFRKGGKTMSEPKDQLIMRMGSFDVSLEMLARLLNLPEADEVVHVEYKFQPRLINIIVRGSEQSELPLVSEGYEPERVSPVYLRDEKGKVTFIEY
jgi:hypothetical protein